ncbi:Rid family hydrolase [Poseidonocella sp. HB161398]|uniref:Rid family hydrolase n=1 Tax=Poseidonocella sp. HB161398 TaxID=2320855 RepID=UPI001109CD1C|nr:Rid family hydrolase [Poseidonocella sp. HB161398]
MTIHQTSAIVPAGMESAGPDYGFAPGRVAGGLLFVSGQIGVDGTGALGATEQEQARLALANLGRVLEAAGCGFADIVEMTTMHVGDCTKVNAWFLDLKKDLFADPYPAWTSMGVTSLAIPGALIEISAVAALPQA